MYRVFIVIAFTSLMQPPGTACFKFYITRDLNNTIQLQKAEWTHVEVTISDQSVTIKFDIPKDLSYSDAFIFFANDNKTILQVELGKKVLGKFYASPYNRIKEMEGEVTTKVEYDVFCQVVGTFPITWLPEKCSKVSASVVAGRYFNYYKLQNFKISLPDLMVVEEYMKIPDPIKIYGQNHEFLTKKITAS